MVWSLETSQGYESTKIAHLVIPYTQGKCLDIGCGLKKVWPSLIGIDSLKDYGGQRPQEIDVVGSGETLDLFGDKTLDGVFSSHFLEHVVDYKACLKEWWRVLKYDGYLTLYLPHAKHYPKIGEPGGNPDHKHDFLPDDILNAMMEIGSWELLENEERSKNNEYSFFMVFKKLKSHHTKRIHKHNIWQRNPDGKKRALVIRYGAIGDMILASSVLPELKKKGYHLTFNTAPNGYEVLRSNPHIDEWMVQEKDFVPNRELGPFWQQIALEGRYDRIINLCESIEGGLLTLPDRLQHMYTDETRRKLFGSVNYMERTHDIAEVPYEFDARFYPDIAEKNWARKEREKIKAPVVAWAISGSAQHKVYPWVQIVAAWLLENSNAHLFILGDDKQGKQLQDGIIATLEKDKIDHARIHKMCGKWTVREALSFVQEVDCLVGPETGLLNAVGLEKNAKVIYLSHSSHDNLTRYWKNTIVLSPDIGKCACFPCHRLHYTLDHCPQDAATQAALCASSIAPKRIFESIMKALNFKRMTKPAHDEPEPPVTPSGGTSGMAMAA